MSSGPGMSAIEVRNEFRSMDIIPRFPRIVFHSVPLPLDKVPQFLVDHLAVQYLLDNPFLFSINDLRRRGRLWTSTRDWVRSSWCQFDNIENGMKAAQGRRESESISPVSDFLNNRERAQATMGKFPRRPSGPNISGVKVDLVSGLIVRGPSPSPVIVTSHVVL
jgi:hypothetical protein